jgi:branched-chain amino acid aminotransferase
LITPSLEQGSILSGITRMSVLELAKDMGMKVTERRIAFQEVVEAHKAGKLTECFGTGTAAIISPVGQLTYKGQDYIINNNEIGSLSNKLYDTILDIQYSDSKDSKDWNLHFAL